MTIASEMARVYRSTVNGQISTSDGARLIYQLKEIRCAREAVNAEVAAAKVAAQENIERAPMAVNIIAVPQGCYRQPDGSFAPMPEAMLQIEHSPDAAMQSSEDEDRIIKNLKNEINELAAKMGTDLVV